jgi:hypothetical protein
MLAPHEADPRRLERPAAEHARGRLGPFRAAAIAGDIDDQHLRARSLEAGEAVDHGLAKPPVSVGDDAVLARIVAGGVQRDTERGDSLRTE